MAELRPLHGWTGPPARLTLWHPTAEALACAERAPPSAVPPSYEQAQHLRSFRACERQQEEMARLLIVVWEEPGQCDIQAMSDVVTQHLRRHDTYHSRFEELGADIVRHVFADPADIRMEPVTLGEVSAEEWQRHAAAVPSPYEWDCFRFGVLQRVDGFTCFASIDHLHGDVSVVRLMMREIHAAYRALIDTATPLRLPPPRTFCLEEGGQLQGCRLAIARLVDVAVMPMAAVIRELRTEALPCVQAAGHPAFLP